MRRCDFPPSAQFAGAGVAELVAPCPEREAPQAKSEDGSVRREKSNLQRFAKGFLFVFVLRCRGFFLIGGLSGTSPVQSCDSLQAGHKRKSMQG